VKPPQRGKRFLGVQTRRSVQRTENISSGKKPNSTIFVSIFHRRLFSKIKLETNKKLIYLLSKSVLMINPRTEFFWAPQI
jgi:hypothetical protein